MRTRGGAVCNRHRRWHIDGADVDVSQFPEYMRAERCLSGSLWKRGVGLTTGELQLSASLIRQWAADDALPERFQSRMDVFGTGTVDQDSVFRIAFPEVVSLATVLTDLSFASYLLSPRFRLAQQVWALEAAVITIMHSATTERLHEVSEQIVRRGREAVEVANGMRQNANNTRPASLEKALVAAAQRHRTCLLRHLSTVRMPKLPFEPGVAAPPRNRVLEKRRPLPDLDYFDDGHATISGGASAQLHRAAMA